MDDNVKISEQRNLKIDGNVFEPGKEENAQFQTSASKLLSNENAFALRDKLRDASYTLRNGKKGKKTNHTVPMKHVIEKLDAVQKALSWQVDADDEMIRAQLGSITSALKEVLYACDEYIDGHKNPRSDEGQVRKSYVLKIREMIKSDTAMLTARTNQYIADKKAGIERQNEQGIVGDQSITWLTLFASARCEQIEEKNGIRIEKGGDMGSGMLIVKQQGKKNRYLKLDERKREHSAGAAIELVGTRLNRMITGMNELEQTEEQQAKIAALTRQNGYLNSFKEALVACRGSSALTRSKVGSVQAVFLRNLRQRKKDTDALRNIVSVLGLGGTSFGETVNKAVRDKESAIKRKNSLNSSMRKLDQQMKKLDKSDPKYKTLDDEYVKLEAERDQQNEILTQVQNTITELFEVMDQLGKQMNSDDMASVMARITPGTSLAKRNVATYRLAKHLGLGNMVAKAELKEVRMNGTVSTYMEMEAAEGQEPDVIAYNKAEKTYRYSPKAVEQLSSLQVFDIICGQVDRHRANYLAVTEEKDGVVIMKEIKAIDNDLSHGLLTYEEIKADQHYQQIRSIEDKDGNVRIPAISDELAVKIMELTPGMVDYLVIDLLSKAEISALKARIRGVQKLIERRRKQESNRKGSPSWFAKTTKDWERVRAEIEDMAEDEVLDEEVYHIDIKEDPDVRHEGELYNSTYYHANWLNVKRRGGKFVKS